MPKEENIKTTPVVRGLKNIRKIKRLILKLNLKLFLKYLNKRRGCNYFVCKISYIFRTILT